MITRVVIYWLRKTGSVFCRESELWYCFGEKNCDQVINSLRHINKVSAGLFPSL